MGIFRPRKPLSRARRVTRALIWLTFGLVAWMRWTMPEPPPRYFNQGGRGAGGPRPTPIYKPVGAIPKDLPRLEIEVTRGDYETLLGYHWGGWGRRGREQAMPQERPEVKVTVREGGVTYTDVALHPKGSAGSFRPFDEKPAMTLNFSKHVKGRTFRGYSKISLNNSVQDPTFLSEAICRELFVQAGVPATRVEHATVVVNGRDLGLYVVSEGWGKPFLRRFFDNVDGNLYDSGFVTDVDGDLGVNSGDDRDSKEDLARLVEAATRSEASNRWERLNEVLDMDRFLTFMALEVMTCHWDGYSMNRNNYRVFHDRGTGKMVFMPHGLDQTFGTGHRMPPNATIRQRMEGMVARAVMGTPEGRTGYRERMALLREKVFVEETLTNRVWELARRLQPTLTAYSPGLASEHRAWVEDFANRISLRVRSLTEQLSAPVGEDFTLRFDESGIARLAGWEPTVTDRAFRAVRFDLERSAEARYLKISTGPSGGKGSWRTEVELPPGRYRFEGRAQPSGIGAEGGVRLRRSGETPILQQLEEDRWTELTFEFELEDPLNDVVLVCELVSSGGVVWFDQGSLRLVRLP